MSCVSGAAPKVVNSTEHIKRELITTNTISVITPGQTTVTVPPGAVSMVVDMCGARGGCDTNTRGVIGGKGARVQATFMVTQGTQYFLRVGGKGMDVFGGNFTGGFNGGNSILYWFTKNI